MKITLDVPQRRALYGLLKLLASEETTQVGALFWLDMANRLGPNQLTAEFRREEVITMLECVTKSIDTLTRSMKANSVSLEQQLRADTINKILAGAKERLAEKLALNPVKDEEDGI